MPLANGVAEQQALQTEFPAVLFAGLAQTKGFALGAMQPPTNARVFQPTGHQRDIAGRQPETGLERRNFQQGSQTGLREAFRARAEQPFHGDQQR